MAEPFIGEIRLLALSYPPYGWAACDGTLLNISQNTALFSILGTYYGGDGVRTFALPDLRGRAPMGTGAGPGLTSRAIGNSGGSETVVLTSDQLPLHTHALQVAASPAQSGNPQSRVPAVSDEDTYLAAGFGQTVAMHSQMIGVGGGGQAHNNLQPFLPVSFCIALTGIFPSRA